MTGSNKQIKKLTGEIISHKTPKTAVVLVVSIKVHPKYHKRYTVAKKYMAHDEQNAYAVGDRVEIMPCRPRSKRKRFIITGKLT